MKINTWQHVSDEVIGEATSYWTVYFILNCHGYIGAGPRYGICPYQPAKALDKPINTKKIDEKSAKNCEKR